MLVVPQSKTVFEGRLTLTTVLPVLTGAVATAATVFYTPYEGNQISLWDGVKFVPQTFSELSNVLANSAVGNAGPAAGAAAKNYDLFVWSNNGVPTLTRGGAWNSDTARSATTENDLQRVQGVLVNLNAITNGPAAGYGSYVGTIRTDAGGATVSWSVGGGAGGGTPATLNVWNMYNRVLVQAVVRDTTASWAYTTATVRAANAAVGSGLGNRISMIKGLNEDAVDAAYQCRFSTAAAANGFGLIGLGLDSTSAYAGQPGTIINILAAGQTGVEVTSGPLATAQVGLGFHFIQACEQGDGTNATTYIGANSMCLKVATLQ